MTAPMSFRRRHPTPVGERPDRTPQLRADRYKYGYRTCRMIIPTMVRRVMGVDVTLAAVWMGRG
jgi:hypothetical protein